MLFNSVTYIFLFLPLVVIGYYGLIRFRYLLAAKVWLLFASLFFYAYWDTRYLILILNSMLVNFGIGASLSQGITQTHGKTQRKVLLVVGLVFNLSLLGYYKYFNFFLKSLNSGFGYDFSIQEIILPLAISFFTFQQMAYLVDSYRAETKEIDFLNYCLFVTFFPQLIAGPIVHHQEMMPQFASKRSAVVNWRNIQAGTFIFFLGLAKKVIVADYFALWADQGYGQVSSLTFISAWATSLSYTMQLYFDFSGYTDMAIGAALLFNVKLPFNFDSPYKALSIQEFWRRWHMTLSRWLRDYLYIPLGGNRCSEWRIYINLFLTFILGGIWHGAGWTFVLWGALHGVALCVNRFWSKKGIKLPVFISWSVTILFVNFTWVFFRAENLDIVEQFVTAMLDFRTIDFSWEFLDQCSFFTGVNLSHTFLGKSIPAFEFPLLFGLVCLFSCVYFKNSNSFQKRMLAKSTKLSIKEFIVLVMLATTSIYFLIVQKSEVFLYFNF